MKKILLFVSAVVVLLIAISGYSKSASGYLNTETVTVCKKDSAVVLAGSYVDSGRVFGWFDKKQMILYEDPSGLLENAELKGIGCIHITGDKKNGLEKGYITVKPKKEKLSVKQTDSVKVYEKMYFEACSTCHAASDPKRYTAMQWDGILKSMKPHTNLQDKQIAGIYRYIKIAISEN